MIDVDRDLQEWLDNSESVGVENMPNPVSDAFEVINDICNRQFEPDVRLDEALDEALYNLGEAAADVTRTEWSDTFHKETLRKLMNKVLGRNET